MARKRRSSGEDTQERILRVATPLFAQHGYAGTSTRMVAGAADVNVATLAYYFDGKQGLYTAVVQRMHEELDAAAPDEPPPVEPEKLPEWVARFAWRFAREHQVHIKVLIRNVLDTGGHADVVMDRWSDPLLDKAAQVVGMVRPSWSVVKRRLLTLTVMHAVARFAIEDRAQLEQMAGHPDDLDAAIESWIADLLRTQLGLPGGELPGGG